MKSQDRFTTLAFSYSVAESFFQLVTSRIMSGNHSLLSSGLRKKCQVLGQESSPTGTPRALFLMSVERSRNKRPADAGICASHLNCAHVR